MLKLTEIYIYPIKGLPGISVSSARVEARGLQYDRRWMLVDEQGVFISQRSFSILSQFKINVVSTGFWVQAPDELSSQIIPFEGFGKSQKVSVWDDELLAQNYSDSLNNWFSKILGINCFLVYLPIWSERKLDVKFNSGNDLVSFADGFPILLISKESLYDLNQRLLEPVLMDRFRPNLVFEGGKPYQEDSIGEFSIGDALFLGSKPCARCQVPTINQQTGIAGKEPSKTLSTYRMANNKIYFGENVKPLNVFQSIEIGMEILVKSWKDSLI